VLEERQVLELMDHIRGDLNASLHQLLSIVVTVLVPAKILLDKRSDVPAPSENSSSHASVAGDVTERCKTMALLVNNVLDI
jgi:hypothetical protein